MKMNKYENVDEYIANFPDHIQKSLQQIRKTVSKLAPSTTEAISYGIPTFKLHGKNMIHFAGYDTHIGFYPGAAIIEQFADKLSGYKISKGTIQFKIDSQLPVDLITDMTLAAKANLVKHGT